MLNDEFENVRIKNHTCYYFDDIVKLEDFHLDNILIDENYFRFMKFHVKV